MYEEIYCDSLKWWTNGWVDYLAPQLYWKINPPDQSYTALLNWWAEHNTKHRNLYPGMNTGKIGGTNWVAEEIVNQIKVTRATPGANGHIHWPFTTVMKNKVGIADEIKNLYAKPALVPASPWLNNMVPIKPSLTGKRQKNGIKAQWNSLSREKTSLWVFQQFVGNEWKTQIFPGEQSSLVIAGSEMPSAIAISSVNRYGTKSQPAIFEFEK
jgi:hypothetical protein